MNELAHTASKHTDYTGSKLGMWFFLFTEILLFGGLFLVYSVYRAVHQEAFHTAAKELSTMLGAINTVVLLTSSLTMALAIAALRQGKRTASIIYQLVTILLGIAFLVNKYFEWSGHIHQGIYPNSPEPALAGPWRDLVLRSVLCHDRAAWAACARRCAADRDHAVVHAQREHYG